MPDGGVLAVSAAGPDPAWSRFARAFVHETRSPLNALAIYLELVGTRQGNGQDGKGDPALQRILTKAQDQVRRVDELLRIFSELWAPRGDVTNLAAIVRAAARFSQHEAIRRGFVLKQEICERANIAAPPLLTSGAIVALFGAVLQAPPESQLTVTLELRDAGESAVLTFSVQLPPAFEGDLLSRGAEALSVLGADVSRTENTLTSVFRTSLSEDAAA
jgi:signal transduction histidine kinase